MIRTKCISILYSKSFLFIDIFHDMMLFLCYFGLFYTVCNFPVPKQQTQDSAEKVDAELLKKNTSKLPENRRREFFERLTKTRRRGDRGGPKGAQEATWHGHTPGALGPPQAPPSSLYT